MMRKGALLGLLLLSLVFSTRCGLVTDESAPTAGPTIIDGFTVLLTEPEVQFPDSIDFRLEVQAKADISRIALSYQVEKRSAIPITSIAFPRFEPSPEVDTSWKWDMRKTGALPPGTQVRYWWSITDAEGNQVETKTDILSFDDHHHSWKSLEGDRINLLWYDGSNAFGQELLGAAEAALDRVSSDTGVQLDAKAAVYIYASAGDLRAAMVYPPEWTGGRAFPEYGTIAIGIAPGNEEWGKRAIAHELAHLVFHQAIFSGYSAQMPTWLDEGLATYAEGPLSSSMKDILATAVQRQSLFSLRSLCSSFPAQTELALLAYAQSYSVVEFLLQPGQGGKEKVLELLDAFKQGNGYVEALDQVYGLSIDELDSLWRQYIRAPVSYVSFVCSG